MIAMMIEVGELSNAGGALAVIALCVLAAWMIAPRQR